MRGDFFINRIIGILGVAITLDRLPIFGGGGPDVLRAVGVMIAFGVKPAQFKKDIATAGIFPQSFEQNLVGLGGFVHALAQPVGRDGIVLDILRIKLGGK